MDSSELTTLCASLSIKENEGQALELDRENGVEPTGAVETSDKLSGSSGKDRGRGPVLVVKDTVGKGKEVANHYNEGQVGVASENVNHHGGYTVVQSKGGSGMSVIPLNGTLQSELKLQKPEQGKMGTNKGACVLIANDNAIPTMESIKKTKEKEGDSLMNLDVETNTGRRRNKWKRRARDVRMAGSGRTHMVMSGKRPSDTSDSGDYEQMKKNRLDITGMCRVSDVGGIVQDMEEIYDNMQG
ncbi:hypothetical protein ACOSQ4_021701 [Xanthoceras sorbifolium]